MRHPVAERRVGQRVAVDHRLRHHHDRLGRPVVVAFAFAALFALDRDVALFGAWRRYLGLSQMLDNGITYLAASTLFPTVTDLKRLLAVGSAVLVPVVAYGFAQQHGVDPVSYTQSTLRPISTLGQPDMLAGYLSIAVSTTFAAAVVLWRPLRWPGRALLTAAAGACVVALLSTSIRSGLLGAARRRGRPPDPAGDRPVGDQARVAGDRAAVRDRRGGRGGRPRAG